MFVLRLSIWIALLCWLAGPASALAGRRRERWQRAARWLWTVGCAAFLVHVAAAFHVVHGWSHAAAYAATARDTAAVTGVDSGFGLWLNYLFTALWVADAAAWWRLGTQGYRRRARWITASVYGFMAFLAFHATVVFEEGGVRLAGLLATVGLAGLLFVSLLIVSLRPPRISGLESPASHRRPRIADGPGRGER